MRKVIAPVSSLSGEIGLPGDKSISHRYAMIAAIAEGESRIRNYSTGADCHSTLGACGRWELRSRAPARSSPSAAAAWTDFARPWPAWTRATPAPPSA